MRKFLKVSAVVVGAFVIIAGIWTVDNLIYPFKSETPNFADVERAFNKLKVPSDWQEVSSSENRGLYGRGCNPLNDSGCFHKGKTFSIPENINTNNLINVFNENKLCPALNVSEIDYKGQTEKTANFSCGIGGGLEIRGTIRGPENEISFFVSSL